MFLETRYPILTSGFEHLIGEAETQLAAGDNPWLRNDLAVLNALACRFSEARALWQPLLDTGHPLAHLNSVLLDAISDRLPHPGLIPQPVAAAPTTTACRETPVSIVIVEYNRYDYLRRCLEALAATTESGRVEVVVVDNSTDGELARHVAAAEHPDIVYDDSGGNLGFARGCNRGATLARHEHICFLNNDVEPQQGWLDPLVASKLADPDVGLVGSRLLYPDGRLQHAGMAFFLGMPLPFHPYRFLPADHPAANRPMTMPSLTGACLLTDRTTFEALGRFDEGYVNGFEDVELCLQALESGRRCVYRPDSLALHHESVSEGRFTHESDNEKRFKARWLGRMLIDSPIAPDHWFLIGTAAAAHAPARVARNLGRLLACLETDPGLWERLPPGRVARRMHEPGHRFFANLAERALKQGQLDDAALLFRLAQGPIPWRPSLWGWRRRCRRSQAP